MDIAGARRRQQETSPSAPKRHFSGTSSVVQGDRLLRGEGFTRQVASESTNVALNSYISTYRDPAGVHVFLLTSRTWPLTRCDEMQKTQSSADALWEFFWQSQTSYAWQVYTMELEIPTPTRKAPTST